MGGESCFYSCNWLGGFVGPCRSKRGATLSFLIVTCVAAILFFFFELAATRKLQLAAAYVMILMIAP